MFFWRGKGWLVPLTIFGSGLLVEWIVESISGNDFFYQENAWPVFIANLLPAPFFWIWGNKINEGLSGNRKLTDYTDVEVGPNIEVKLKQHSFMFIPIQYWSFGTTLFAIWLLSQKL